MKNLAVKPIFGLGKDKCPVGTVPIRRTTKDGLIQDNSLLNNHILTQDKPGTHVNILFYKILLNILNLFL